MVDLSWNPAHDLTADSHTRTVSLSRAPTLTFNTSHAHRVVIVDPSWNPAHDLQAQDRAFRIGQRRDVGVFRLVSTGCQAALVPTLHHTYCLDTQYA